MKWNWIKRICCIMICALICAGFVACQDSGPDPEPPEPTSNGTSVEDALNTKKKLYFDDLGNFKVMIFSDLRVSKTVDSKIIQNMEKLLDKEKPDLVILGGDVHDGTISNEGELRTVLDALNAPLEEREIPWCHAFGVNTEGTEKQKTGYSREDQMKVYQSYPYCLSAADNENTYGVSNYVLPVLVADKNGDPTKDRVGFNVWCLDSNSYLNDYEAGLEDKVLLKSLIGGKTNLDSLHYSQVLWYYDTSVALEEYNGGNRIFGMMYFQVPVMQFNIVKNNPTKTGFVGSSLPAATKISAPERETGIFYTCSERGDVRGIFCGYNVENDFYGEYMNIRLGFCSTIGQTKVRETAGARVVSVTKNGKFMESSMSYLQ